MRKDESGSDRGLGDQRGTARVALALWVLVILTATSIPFADPSRFVPSWPWADKLAHMGLYSMLGLLAAWAFLPARPVSPASGAGDGRSQVPGVGWLLLLSIAIFAGADELHQVWIRGRSPSGADWLADVVGASVGLMIGARWGREGMSSASVAFREDDG